MEAMGGSPATLWPGTEMPPQQAPPPAPDLGTPESPIDASEVEGLGLHVDERFVVFRSGKLPFETRWKKSLRYTDGEYLEGELDNVDPNKSRVFINLTQAEVSKAKSLILQLLDGGMPYDLRPSADPDLNEDSVGVLRDAVNLASLQIPKEERDAFLKENNFEELAQEEKSSARLKAERMRLEVQDNLDAMRWDESLIRGLDPLTIYGNIVVQGPISVPRAPQKWHQDNAGKWKVALKRGAALDKGKDDLKAEDLRPAYKVLDPFQVYVDPAATKTEDISEVIVRYVVNQHQLRELKKDPTFFSKAIDEVMASGKGNWVAEMWETAVEPDAVNSQTTYSRYIMLDYYGFMSGAELKRFHVDIPEGLENQDVLANIVTVGGKVIKAMVDNREPARIPFFFVPYKIKPGQLWGVGVPETMEDSQRIYNAAERAKMDNAALSVGPQVVVDMELLNPADNDGKVYPLKVWRIERMEGLGRDPVQFFQPSSNVAQMNAIQEAVRWHMQKETQIPDFALGMPTAPQHNRSAEGLAMQQSAAMNFIRTVIANLDTFLIAPMIHSLYDWNMQFNPDQSIKGDYEVVAKGVIGAMSREVMAQRLIQFMQLFSNDMLQDYPKVDKVGTLLAQAIGVYDMDITYTDKEAAERRAKRMEKEASIKDGPKRMQPTIPPGNAAIEILGNTQDSSPLYGPIYEVALGTNGFMDSPAGPKFKAALNAVNEIALNAVKNALSKPDQISLGEDIAGPPAPPPPHPLDGGPPAAGPASAPPMGMP